MENRWEIKHAIQDDYAKDYARCYGCGRINENGFGIRTGWDGDRTLTIFQPRQEHTAIPRFIYGGLIAPLIDCHSTASVA